MRKIAPAAMVLLMGLAFAGCNEESTAELPPPHELTDTAIGNYCGMTLVEHSGPKGQIILASRDEPVWFSSARDAFAYTMLPEEPKDIRAIYVSDMAKAQSWEKPGTKNWIDAKKAYYVIGSRLKGGMGADETIPFSGKGAAEQFTAGNGGRVVGFADVPTDYVLGSGGPAASTGEQGTTLTHDPKDDAGSTPRIGE
jgi:copper chaperone NosL